MADPGPPPDLDHHAGNPTTAPNAPSGTDAARLVAGLDDHAVQALALVVNRDRPPSPTDPDLAIHLRQAATATDTSDDLPPAGVSAEAAVSDANLARATHPHLPRFQPGTAT